MTTPIALRDWRLLAAGCGGLLLLAAAITLHSHWGDFLQWCLATQITLHRYLVMYLLLLNNHQYSGGIWLLVGAFLYGVLHAVGPGHGKFIVTTYLSTNQESLTAARVVPFLGSLLQGVSDTLCLYSCGGAESGRWRSQRQPLVRREDQRPDHRRLWGLCYLSRSAKPVADKTGDSPSDASASA
jgi:hypothetical protein